MSEFRKRIIDPMLPPVVAIGVIGVLVFSFSRILLAIPEMGSTTIALLIAAEILALCAVFAATTRVQAGQRIVLALMVLGLIGGGVASAALGVRPIEGHGESIVVAAKGVEFTTTELQFPADENVNLIFNNQDPGVEHDVSILNPSGRGLLFNGENITGPDRIAYEIEPLAEGTYTFICEVHPTTMVGEIHAGEGAGHGPAPTASPTPTPTPTPTKAPTGAAQEAEIVANNLQFDLKEMTLRANAPTTLTLDNRETPQHNWALYTEAGGDVIFRGELFSGPASREYTFTTPAPGTYYFQCDAHPGTMNGTAKIT